MKLATLEVTLILPITGMIKDAAYKVDRVTNSIEYNPGDYLSRVKIGDLCKNPDWKIVIRKRKVNHTA